jgi:hypothetical protein
LHYAHDPAEHARIFGQPERADTPGRSRSCASCGGWHRTDKPWPHNCRSAPPARSALAAPPVYATFDAFRTGVMAGAETITSRNERREYMARHGLVDHDPGVQREVDHWTWEREQEREVVQTVKRFMETDPLNIPPDLKATERVGDSDLGGAGVEGAGDIDTSSMEIIE